MFTYNVQRVLVLLLILTIKKLPNCLTCAKLSPQPPPALDNLEDGQFRHFESSSDTSSMSKQLDDALIDPKLKENAGDLWIVLVSGIPNGLAYSTESDICRTYQIAKRNGIPDERIIIFMHDVAGPAHDNTLYNEEGGPNVYVGVPKDYTGDNWTKENFLDVMRGKEMRRGSRKTLRTKKNDKIFVSFESHGGPGGIAMFGNGMLKSDELYDTVSYMHHHKMYGKMVVYWMTCFAGAMFDKYSPKYQHKNVYVVTSQTPYDESLACEHEHTSDGKIMCSLFGKVWMEYVESVDTSAKTMQLLYVNLTAETVEDSVGMQVPLEYGDKYMDKAVISDFLGKDHVTKNHSLIKSSIENEKSVGGYPTMCDSLIYQLKIKLKSASTQTEAHNLEDMIDSIKKTRKMASSKISAIVEEVSRLQDGNDVDDYDERQVKPNSWQQVYSQMTSNDIKECFYQMVTIFKENCTSVHNGDWCSMTHPTKEFMQLCNSRFSIDLFNSIINRHC